MAGTGQKTHSEVRKWSGDPPGGLKVDGRHSQWSRSGRETLPEVRNWSGDATGDSDLVGRPYRRS